MINLERAWNECLELLPSKSLWLNFWWLEGRMEAADTECPISPPKEEAVRKSSWDTQKGHLPVSKANAGLMRCEALWFLLTSFSPYSLWSCYAFFTVWHTPL